MKPTGRKRSGFPVWQWIIDTPIHSFVSDGDQGDVVVPDGAWVHEDSGDVVLGRGGDPEFEARHILAQHIENERQHMAREERAVTVYQT